MRGGSGVGVGGSGVGDGGIRVGEGATGVTLAWPALVVAAVPVEAGSAVGDPGCSVCLQPTIIAASNASKMLREELIHHPRRERALYDNSVWIIPLR